MRTLVFALFAFTSLVLPALAQERVEYHKLESREGRLLIQYRLRGEILTAPVPSSLVGTARQLSALHDLRNTTLTVEDGIGTTDVEDAMFSPAQVEEIRRTSAELSNEFAQLVVKAQDRDFQDESIKRDKEVLDERLRKSRDLLLDHQRVRLSQVKVWNSIQESGLIDVLLSDAGDSLEITTDQKRQLRELQKELQGDFATDLEAIILEQRVKFFNSLDRHMQEKFRLLYGDSLDEVVKHRESDANLLLIINQFYRF